jgi:rhodanese-related sulfurtransferase
MPWGAPLTLLGASSEQVAEAQRELARIGIDRFQGAATGRPEDWSTDGLGSFPTASFADLRAVRHHRLVAVLDVRRTSEFDERHLQGATSIPIHELPHRLHDVPAGEVWVPCASGYRASIAASLLAAQGTEVVAVDDDFGRRAADAGLPFAGTAA